MIKFEHLEKHLNTETSFNTQKHFWTTTVWKLSKYGIFSGPYLPEFSPNTGKYGPGKTPHFDTFHAVDNTSVEGNKKRK